MLYIALDILKNKELAEETVHDSMIAIMKSINEIDEIKCHKTHGLVVLITKRLSYNKLKYEKRRHHASTDDIQYVNTREKSIDDIVIDKITMEKLVQEMKSITSDDYCTIILKYYYGYSYREIARHLNIKESTARKRCERAKKYLLNKAISKGVTP